MNDRLRVVIAEDHYLVREGTRRLLEDSGQVEVIAAVGTTEELLDAVGRLKPDAVITDIRMPPSHHMEGIEAAHAVRTASSEIGVVVLSQHADSTYASELLKNGAGGFAYLLKERVGDVEEIVHALREVVAGRSVIDPRIVDALITRGRRNSTSPLAGLSDRELQVLKAMAEGKSNAAIGASLFLSESSVEKHVSAIFGKLGLADEPAIHRRVAAAVTFLRQEVVDVHVPRADSSN